MCDRWSIAHFSEGLAQLVRATGSFYSALYALKTLYHLAGVHAFDEMTNTLYVSATSSYDFYVPDYIAFGLDFDASATCT